MTRNLASCLGVAALVLCASSVWAADDFVGKWDVEYEYQGNEISAALSITKTDDGLKGTWTGRRGETELTNVKVKDGMLTFDRHLDFGGGFDLAHEAKLKDGKLVGKMISPQGERPFSGVLQGSDAGFVGEWDVKLEIQDRVIEAKLTIKEDDGKLAGVWASQRGDAELEDVKIENGELTFVRELERQGQAFTLDYVAKIEDGALSGIVNSPMGELPFTGTRVKKEEAEGESRVARMMARMDTNGDGLIQEDEAPEQMKNFFGMIDSNADGSIDMKELEAMIQYMGQNNPNQ